MKSPKRSTSRVSANARKSCRKSVMVHRRMEAPAEAEHAGGEREGEKPPREMGHGAGEKGSPRQYIQRARVNSRVFRVLRALWRVSELLVRVITFNVNGIRSAERKGFARWLTR